MTGKSRIVLILAFLLIVSPCFSDTASDLLRTGRKAFGDGQYSLAAQSFKTIAAQFPESQKAPEAHYLLGVCSFYLGNWAEAIEALELLRAQHPQSAYISRSSYWLGAACLKLGRFDPALGYLSEHPVGSGETDPYRFHALLLKGITLEALGRDAEAAASYRNVLLEKSARVLFPEASYRLAGTEYRSGHLVVARDLYGKALLDDPHSPFIRDSVFFLAECELALGNLGEAEKRYRTILTLYPDSPYRDAATFRLADIAWRQKKTAQALDQLDAMQKQFPGGAYRGNALRLRADILLAQKKYEPALAAYALAIDALADGSERQSALYSRALAELALGRKADAADSFARAGTGSSREVAEKAGYERAILLAGAGNDAAAIQALDRYVKEFPDSAKSEEACRLLASMLVKNGDDEAALSRWELLVKGYPRSASFPEYLFRRGSALLLLGRASAALDDFQRVAKEFPRSIWRNESSYAIGYVYAQRGEHTRALPYFQSAARDAGASEVGERSRLAVGICLFNMGSFDKTLARLQELRGQKPKTVAEGTIVLYMGRALYRLERLDEAAQLLGESAALLVPAGDGGAGASADGAEALYWLGWAELRRNRLAEARDAFLIAARKYPAHPRSVDALFRAGIVLTMQGNDAEAAGVFGRVLATPRRAADDDTREQALYEQGWAFQRLGRGQESTDTFERLAREFRGGRLAAQAYFKRAEQALYARHYEEAWKGFLNLAESFPKSPLAVQALYWAAETSRQSGDLRAALEGFWICIVAGPPPGLLESALDGYGAVVSSLGDIDLARLYSEKARRTRGLAASASASVHLDYADMLLGVRPVEALAVIEDVRRSAPPEPFAGKATLLYGRYLAAVGDWTRAMEIFAALENSRADEIGARAAGERARALEATGRTSEAVDEFLKISYLFPDSTDLAAEGLYNAARVARARGENDRAARVEGTLRKEYPDSPWTRKLDTD